MKILISLVLLVVMVCSFSACSHVVSPVESSAQITGEEVSDLIVEADNRVESVVPIVFTECQHTDTVKKYSFQPSTSRAMSYMQSECTKCYEVLYTNGFVDNPRDLSYLDVMNNGEAFIEGEYYTVVAKVVYNFFSHDRIVKCEVEKDGVIVYFTVTFTEEYKEESGSLSEGDIITFRGKAAPEGRVYWTDCELITD